MTKEEIQDRLDQAQVKVDKRLATISKICKKLNINYENITKAYYDLENSITSDYLPSRKSKEFVANFIQEKPARDEYGNWDDDAYDFNDKISQLEDSFVKLYDLRRVVKNWQLKLEKQTNRENVDQIPVLVEFLDNWERNCKEYYLDQKDRYVNSYNIFHNIVQEFLDENNYNELSYDEKKALVPVFNKFMTQEYNVHPRYTHGAIDVHDWVQSYDTLIKDLTSVKFVSEAPSYKLYDQYFGYGAEDGHYELRSFDEEKLDKILHDEKLRKYQKLVEQVTEITGNITDVSGLSIDERGDLNGIVVGEKGRANVNTIGAGGYNQHYINPETGRHGQVFHFRTLVKPVK